MDRILILKTAALGDVLRTTSILPGLHAAHGAPRIEWVAARGAVDLVRTHPLVARVHALDPADPAACSVLRAELCQTNWTLVVSLDDEAPLCELAAALPCARLAGATLVDGARGYTDDVAEWFDMGLLSRHGKRRADELKVLNRRSQPAIYASMLGIAMGRPRLELPSTELDGARVFWRDHGLDDGVPVVGLNTGAGGRWRGKMLPHEATVETCARLQEELGRPLRFLVLGGAAEAERNRTLLGALLAARLDARDAGVDHSLLFFAALIDRLDALLTSDSLALHMAIARGTPNVSFYAPTSSAEIETYGTGEKVASTAADYCSYLPDADNKTLTPDRLVPALRRRLELGRAPAG
jgi:heptosyltransferase-2